MVLSVMLIQDQNFSVDIEEALDPIRLADRLHKRQIKRNIKRTIDEIYQNNQIQAKINRQRTHRINDRRNITMVEIIRKFCKKKRY